MINIITKGYVNGSFTSKSFDDTQSAYKWCKSEFEKCKVYKNTGHFSNIIKVYVGSRFIGEVTRFGGC